MQHQQNKRFFYGGFIMISTKALDPVNIAKLGINDLRQEVCNVDAVALCVQADLRALLPLDQRAGIVLTDNHGNNNHPEWLVAAQSRCANIYKDDRQATSDETKAALASLTRHTAQLNVVGRTEFAKELSAWVMTNSNSDRTETTPSKFIPRDRVLALKHRNVYNHKRRNR
jgi:hypothetical protein